MLTDEYSVSKGLHLWQTQLSGSSVVVGIFFMVLYSFFFLKLFCVLVSTGRAGLPFCIDRKMVREGTGGSAHK
jgi:hypothetical protein